MCTEQSCGFSAVQTSATSILILLVPNSLLSNRSDYPRAPSLDIRELLRFLISTTFVNKGEESKAGYPRGPVPGILSKGTLRKNPALMQRR
jgi:hypothetical protein